MGSHCGLSLMTSWGTLWEVLVMGLKGVKGMEWGPSLLKVRKDVGGEEGEVFPL